MSLQWVSPEINFVSVIQIILQLYRNSGADQENSIWLVLIKINLLLFVFYVCHAALSVPCLFLAALWSTTGKGLTSWLSCMW